MPNIKSAQVRQRRRRRRQQQQRLALTVIACSMWTVMVSRCSAWSWRLQQRKFFFSWSNVATYVPSSRRYLALSTDDDSSSVDNNIAWHGDMQPFSEYAMHVRVGEKDAPVAVEDAIRCSMGDRVATEIEDRSPYSSKPTFASVAADEPLTPLQLLHLGCLWYLPRKQYEHNQLELPNSIYKSIRLSAANATMTLYKGDYLRIHYQPRRFPAVYNFDWKDPGEKKLSSSSILPSIIIHSTSDFWIIQKPPLIPVHATVDNVVENVVHQLEQANPTADYVVSAQRLDINTSGFMVVARNIEFAAYFGRLLSHKTKDNQNRSVVGDGTCSGSSNVVKRYKCLVCLQETSTSETNESIIQAWQRLQNLQNTTVRHYLEPSIRAPKRFEPDIPSPVSQGSVVAGVPDHSGLLNPKDWLVCLLKITNVSSIFPIPNKDHPLAKRLWTTAEMPPSTKAICEVSIQLETGRTHQIRGQLSQLGFPLVGDEQYGGAIPTTNDVSTTVTNNPQILALQSSYIGFWDADYVERWNKKRRRNITQGVSSNRWVEAALENAWWTSILEQEGIDEDITSAVDAQLAASTAAESSNVDQESHAEKPELLPPSVQLSPGQNKYVLVKVESQKGEIQWFVRSASPKECGGPYHANVAEDLVEWIQAAGFVKITVTGGGRIDYIPTSNRAHVYGFSYGFGKGDHEKAAELIGATGILTTFDNSHSLY